jgi:hypothetical protein
LDFGALEQVPVAKASQGGKDGEDGEGAKDFHQWVS